MVVTDDTSSVPIDGQNEGGKKPMSHEKIAGVTGNRNDIIVLLLVVVIGIEGVLLVRRLHVDSERNLTPRIVLERL